MLKDYALHPQCIIYIFVSVALQPNWGPHHLIFEDSGSHTIRHTSTTVMTPLKEWSVRRIFRYLLNKKTNTIDAHLSPQRDSNPRFPKLNTYSSTSLTSQPPGSANSVCKIKFLLSAVNIVRRHTMKIWLHSILDSVLGGGTALDGAVGWGTALHVGLLRVRFPVVSLEFFIYNPSGRTMFLGSTQPLTGMSTRNISWGKGSRCIGVTPPSCTDCLEFWEPHPLGTHRICLCLYCDCLTWLQYGGVSWASRLGRSSLCKRHCYPLKGRLIGPRRRSEHFENWKKSCWYLSAWSQH